MTDAAELVKLAACPFCGGSAEIERKGSTRVSNIVACTDCGCRLESGDVFDPTASWNRRAAQQDGAKWPYRYAHMCRDDHLQIGHLDSEHEQCPLCRALGELERLHETTGWQSTADLLKQLRCPPEQATQRNDGDR